MEMVYEGNYDNDDKTIYNCDNDHDNEKDDEQENDHDRP